VAELSADPVASDSVAEAPADDESHPRTRAVGLPALSKVDRQSRPSSAGATADHGGEIAVVAKTGSGGEHEE
jgi:hypothetical protein